jgi:hypothetical protein
MTPALPLALSHLSAQKGRSLQFTLCEDASLRVPCESAPLACSLTGPGTKLPGRTLAVACTDDRGARSSTAIVARNACKAVPTASCLAFCKISAGSRASAVAQPDPTRCTTKAVGAVAATAVSGGAAGATIRYTRRRRSSAGAALAGAATALLVLPTPLPGPLTARRVGSSLTDA